MRVRGHLYIRFVLSPTRVHISYCVRCLVGATRILDTWYKIKSHTVAGNRIASTRTPSQQSSYCCLRYYCSSQETLPITVGRHLFKNIWIHYVLDSLNVLKKSALLFRENSENNYLLNWRIAKWRILVYIFGIYPWYIYFKSSKKFTLLNNTKRHYSAAKSENVTHNLQEPGTNIRNIFL